MARGVEKQRREALSCSSLEGNLGTVVSCGCNYEYYSDSLVLGKGISGRYIRIEVLTFLLFCCFLLLLRGWVFFFLVLGLLTWRFSSRNKYLETVLLLVVYIV